LAKYSGSKGLPACNANLELMADIERYILTRWAQIKPGSEVTHSFSIKDSLGEETMPGVAEHQVSHFLDDTKEVVLYIQNAHWSTVSINFDLDPSDSRISIRVEGPNAQELARGIIDRILQLVKQHQNYNGLFHPLGFGPLGAVICGMISSAGFTVAVGKLGTSLTSGALSVARFSGTGIT
jgi:hypothetical protein